jgi:hypothetical protein
MAAYDEMLAKIRAEADQALEASRNYARLIAAYRAELEAQGWSKEDSLEMAKTCQAAMLQMPPGDG